MYLYRHVVSITNLPHWSDTGGVREGMRRYVLEEIYGAKRRQTLGPPWIARGPFHNCRGGAEAPAVDSETLLASLTWSSQAWPT